MSGADASEALRIPGDYAFYDQRASKVQRLEMVFDAIMDTEAPLLIIGTSEGGAIVQKCMESAKLARHMRKHGMRVALLSPAYALGDASIDGLFIDD